MGARSDTVKNYLPRLLPFSVLNAGAEKELMREILRLKALRRRFLDQVWR